MSKSVRLPRKELYDLVWSKPMQQLAKEFDLSDVGLAKICKKHNIPRPERGYWAKLEYGKPVKKKSLPDEGNNDLIVIGISAEQGKKNHPISYSQQIKEKRKQYPVCENLRGCHPLISDIKNRVWKENFRFPKIFYPEGIEKKRIMVSHSSKDRALRFLNNLFKYIEARGHEVKMYQQKRDYYNWNDQSPNLIIKGQEVEFIIREKLDQHEKEEKKSEWDSKYIYNPSGKLIFEIDSYCAPRQRWSDGSVHKIEEYLYDIILNILFTARKKSEKDRIAWHEEELRIENEKRRFEEEKQKQIEVKKIQNLETEAANWKKSQEIREYLKATEAFVSEQHGGYEEGSEFGLWLKWAYKYADQIDPLKM